MGAVSQIKTPNNSVYDISVPFVVGTGTTAGTWLGTLNGLAAYYDGLLILYKPSVAGASTTTLNLNSLGAKTCYFNNTTKLTTHFPANQPILLVYSASQNNGCWMITDNCNSNTNDAVTQTATNTNANYEVLFSATADNTTRTEGARKYSNLLFNPSTGNLQATQLNGVTIGSSPKFTDTNTTYSAGTGLSLSGTTFSVKTSDIVNLIYPVGSIFISTVNTNPGTYISGTTWTVFGKGKTLVGVSSDDTDFSSSEKTGGAKTVTLTSAQSGVPAHAHGLNSHTHSVGAHAHGLNSHTHTYDKSSATSGSTKLSVANLPAHTHPTNTYVTSDQAATFAVSNSGADTSGGGWFVDQFLVKTGKNNRNSGSTGSTTGHTHSITLTSTNSGTASGNTANSTAFNSGAASGNTGNNTAANASAAHENMPPYITVYMFKRTA